LHDFQILDRYNTNILISEWIELKNNDLYKLEIYYLILNENSNRFRIGIEIETNIENKNYNNFINNNYYEKFPNMKTIKLDFYEERDLYEIQILTNVQNNTLVEIGCRDNYNKIFINSQDTVEEFKKKIEILHPDLKDSLIIRKYAFNKDHNYIPLDKYANFTEYSYSNKKSFEKLYSKIKRENIDKLNIVNNTTNEIFGISFMFFIDKLKEEREYRFENNCYFIEYFSKFKNSFIAKNIVSETFSKSFTFNIIKDNKILFSEDFFNRKWDFSLIEKEKFGFIEINFISKFIILIQYPKEVKIITYIINK
jgi:hypothetical protein